MEDTGNSSYGSAPHSPKPLPFDDDDNAFCVTPHDAVTQLHLKDPARDQEEANVSDNGFQGHSAAGIWGSDHSAWPGNVEQLPDTSPCGSLAEIDSLTYETKSTISHSWISTSPQTSSFRRGLWSIPKSRPSAAVHHPRGEDEDLGACIEEECAHDRISV